MERTNFEEGDSTSDIVEDPRCNSKLSDECLRKLDSICPSLELLDVCFCLGNNRKEMLAIMGNRCCGLLNLDLGGCLVVMTARMKEMFINWKRLREINLNWGVHVSTVFVDWMVFSRP
ncbi:hypothetical protein LOK49_Contig289G00004 [Camellia lanceoleosa]|nr:hypothetical protein LOK49_Contig289G00004 [Camellia lanceoleosa]